MSPTRQRVWQSEISKVLGVESSECICSPGYCRGSSLFTDAGPMAEVVFDAGEEGMTRKAFVQQRPCTTDFRYPSDSSSSTDAAAVSSATCGPTRAPSRPNVE